MKFTPAVIQTLKHFATAIEAQAVIINTNSPIFVCDEAKNIIARSNVKQTLDDKPSISIYNIKLLTQIISMFDKQDVEFSIDIEEDKLVFISSDKKIRQELYLADNNMISSIVPNPTKAAGLFDSSFDYEFKLTEAELNNFRLGLTTNSSPIVGFEGDGDGNIDIFCSEVDNQGREESKNRFRITLSEESRQEFKIGFDKQFFCMASGDYTIKINSRMVLFEGNTISYLIVLKQWSTL